MDDIIIGAPMYTDEERPTEGWEVGKVYVYFQEKPGTDVSSMGFQH